MPIEPIQNQPPIREVSNAKPKPEAQPAAKAGKADSVEISEQARELARAQQAVEAAPDVRADKVAELKKQIEEGTYNVPAEALADKLLETNGGQ